MFEKRIPEKYTIASLEITPFSGITMLVYSKPKNYRFMRLPRIVNDEFKSVFDDLKKKFDGKIKRIHAPYPIVPNLIDESNEIDLYGPNGHETIDGVPILRGEMADADAVVLSEKGEVHVFAPADCATLIIEFIEDDSIKYISAHVGLRSIFPKSGNSMIDVICNRLGKDKIKSAKGYIDFSISPSRLTRSIKFPGQEVYNTLIRNKLEELGQLDSADQTEFEVDLKKMTASMFKEKGLTVSIGNNNTDDFNKFWSYRNNQTRNDGIDGRNLVVVVKK